VYFAFWKRRLFATKPLNRSLHFLDFQRFAFASLLSDATRVVVRAEVLRMPTILARDCACSKAGIGGLRCQRGGLPAAKVLFVHAQGVVAKVRYERKKKTK